MDSVNFIKNPSRWIAGGGFLCPVKRYSGNAWPTLGVITEASLTTVIEHNMFAGPPAADAPKHEYKTVEELVADGWMVD